MCLSLQTTQMQSKTEDSERTKMESLRLVCDTEIPINRHKIDSFAESFWQSLESVRAEAQETVQEQAKLAKMKAGLRDAEDEYVKALAVKTRKEAKQMTTRECISATKARIEKLKRTVEVQRARRDEYAAITSRQALDLAMSKEKTNQDIKRNGEIERPFLGVKFTFSNINMKYPNECLFTIRHANDTYTLLDCDLPLNNINELIQELNRTNGLFKFVRIMRGKFEEAAALGLNSQSITLRQDSSTISASAPVISVSTDRSESTVKKNEYQIQHGEVSRQVDKVIYQSESPSKKVNHRRGAIPALLSPKSASSVRRSPRFKRISNRSIRTFGRLRNEDEIDAALSSLYYASDGGVNI